MSALFSSQKTNWGTPSDLYERLNKIYSFTYDAACTNSALLEFLGCIMDDILSSFSLHSFEAREGQVDMWVLVDGCDGSLHYCSRSREDLRDLIRADIKELEAYEKVVCDG